MSRMSKRVRKLILPVAGLAKRLRPLTLRTPKALVQINGGHLLDYMLRDASASGIEEAIIITSPQHKRHFASYIANHKKDFPGIKKIHLRVQRKPLGDGHAVLQALDLVHGEPVAVRFADDLILDSAPTIASLIKFYERYRAPVILLERVPKKLLSRYGVVGIRRMFGSALGLPKGKLHELASFVEKPLPQNAPSNLGVVGGYVLTPAFMARLKRHGSALTSKENDALRLADVFRAALLHGERVYGWEFPGRRLDCGTLEGFYEAQRVLKKRDRTS